jgi:hypothetical protein
MLELKSKKLEIKYNDKILSLSFPTALQVESMQEDLKQNPDSIRPTLNLLEKLGLTKELSENMEIEHIESIIDALTSKKK